MAHEVVFEYYGKLYRDIYMGAGPEKIKRAFAGMPGTKLIRISHNQSNHEKTYETQHVQVLSKTRKRISANGETLARPSSDRVNYR